jgi:hypothetical protein
MVDDSLELRLNLIALLYRPNHSIETFKPVDFLRSAEPGLLE